MNTAKTRIVALTLLLAAGFAAFADVIKYSYDSAGHLTKVDYGASGVIQYTYDKNGNMLTRQVSTGTAAFPAVITSVNTAGAGPDIAQNTWIEIKGANLVPATAPAAGVIWNNAPDFASGKLPTQLAGVSVTVNGKPAYVYFYCSVVTSAVCSSDQINVLTPLDSTLGQVQIVVTNGIVPSLPFTVNMKAVSPSFLLFSPTKYVAAQHSDYSLLGPASLYPGLSTPAKPNEVVTLYAVGFGLPSTPIASGSSTQSGTLPFLPICQIGGAPATLTFAGLIGPGLYQLNVRVPASTINSDASISCTYNGSVTPTGDVIAVHN